MLVLSLILAGICLRFAPHAPNFTPVAAIALFSGVYLNKKYALIVPLLLMVSSDMVIGLHNVAAFTWGSFVLIALLAGPLKKHKNVFGIALGSIAASLLFYVVSNFGVWAMGWYPRTLSGLVQCYVMGLPFLRDFTAATIVYAAIFFGAYEAVKGLVKNTKFSKVLLETL
ncbi:MAG: hypothetical protein PHJ00_07060 [Candidatus Omnitrophica bacterium]|nr:hypothetical protein [Candidatus Omnitrophota bacterium]MDD5654507.1 hypothetical protein [Candidatus Omnitrophota bacterium]